MKIDDAGFPLVWVHFLSPKNEQEPSSFKEFDALLSRKMYFVLLNDEGFNQNYLGNSSDAMKESTRWMKNHKEQLKSYVKALILIEPNNTKRNLAKPFSLLYEKFWGYPLILASSMEEAYELGMELLSRA